MIDGMPQFTKTSFGEPGKLQFTKISRWRQIVVLQHTKNSDFRLVWCGSHVKCCEHWFIPQTKGACEPEFTKEQQKRALSSIPSSTNSFAEIDYGAYLRIVKRWKAPSFSIRFGSEVTCSTPPPSWTLKEEEGQFILSSKQPFHTLFRTSCQKNKQTT